MKRIAVLVSGGGTNLQALLDAQAEDRLGDGKIICVISSKEGAFALERARQHQIEAVTLPAKEFSSPRAYSDALLAELEKRDIDLVVLAGFLRILDGTLLEHYKRRIINVHPSLIPSFCGEGFYGLRVHEAALEYGVKVTGATVHFVDGVVDGGDIILQKAVDILEGDTAESLQKRVMEQAEWDLLPKAVELFCQDKL